jgi:hypothetical protein
MNESGEQYVIQDVTKQDCLRQFILNSIGFGLLFTGLIVLEIWAFSNVKGDYYIRLLGILLLIPVILHSWIMAGHCVRLVVCKQGIKIKYGIYGIFRLFIASSEIKNIYILDKPAGVYIRGMWRTGWLFHGAGCHFIIGNPKAMAIAIICTNSKYIISCLDANKLVQELEQIFSLTNESEDPTTIEAIIKC